MCSSLNGSERFSIRGIRVIRERERRKERGRERVGERERRGWGYWRRKRKRVYKNEGCLFLFYFIFCHFTISKYSAGIISTKSPLNSLVISGWDK